MSLAGKLLRQKLKNLTFSIIKTNSDWLPAELICTK